MTERTKKELDRIGRRMADMNFKVDDAVLQSFQLQVSSLILKDMNITGMYSRSQDAKVGALLKVLDELERFEPTEGTLSSFIGSRLAKRKKDVEREELGLHNTTRSGTDGETEYGYVRDGSLDEPVGNDEDGEELTKGSTIVDPGENTEEKTLLRSSAMEFFTLAMNFRQKLKRENPNRELCYQMSFTDGTVSVLKDIGDVYGYVRHERDIFNAMRISFLDYFMAEECRTLRQVVRTGLKPYSELAENREDKTEPPPQPMPNDVYYSYLKHHENWELSKSRVNDFLAQYYSFVRTNMKFLEAE